MPRSRGRSGHAWRVVSGQVKRESSHCAWCLRPLIPALAWPHPSSTSVDHVVPIARGGHPTARANLCAMHLRCNLEKGTRPLSARPAPLGASRAW